MASGWQQLMQPQSGYSPFYQQQQQQLLQQQQQQQIQQQSSQSDFLFDSRKARNLNWKIIVALFLIFVVTVTEIAFVYIYIKEKFWLEFSAVLGSVLFSILCIFFLYLTKDEPSKNGIFFWVTCCNVDLHLTFLCVLQGLSFCSVFGFPLHFPTRLRVSRRTNVIVFFFSSVNYLF